MIFKCCDEKRKAAVLGNPTLNGIDFVLTRLFAGLPPYQVKRPVARQADQPRLGAATLQVEAMRLLPDLNETIVHRIGGQ